jgi:predicted AlkP superfamily phosphohydrolase/phosphomutase
MDEGRLPNLARVRERGAYMRCASVKPPVTYPAWTTCVTGVNPGKHGIFDFTEMISGSYALRFVNSTFRRAPALWNILSDAGKRVCVLGVPGTYPPEAVNGIMVAGFDSPVATAVERSSVYPASIYEDVKDWRYADFQEHDIGPGWHGMALSRLLEGIATKERIAVNLLQREPWDFFMIVFGEADTASHHFWLFHDPDSPRHRTGPRDAIRRIYERLDAAVGSLVATAGDDIVVGICSDHGFGGAGDGVVHLNNWLAEHGYLRFAPQRGGILKHAALSLVPPTFRGALFRRFGGMAARAESASRFSGIDWDNTRAWSDELNYFPSIRINLQGREPHGQVAPNDYTAFCKDLCASLEQWNVVRKAWRREELYDGPYVDRAPDIILDLALENGYSYSCIRSRGGAAFRRLAAEEHMGGKERGTTGVHRPYGVLFLSKPTVAGAATLQDIAPTILGELGVGAPPMDGTSLLAQPKRQEASDLTRAQEVYSSEQEQHIEQRLRELGYFE